MTYPIHASQGENDDLLVHTLASLAPAPVPTQVYTQRYPLDLCPRLATSTSDLVLSDDLLIALCKGKFQCAHPISSFCSRLSSQSCSFIASLNSILLPNKVSETLAQRGWTRGTTWATHPT